MVSCSWYLLELASSSFSAGKVSVILCYIHLNKSSGQVRLHFCTVLRSISEKVTFSVSKTGFQQVILQFGDALHNLTIFKKSSSHSKYSFLWIFLQKFTWENAWSVFSENPKLSFCYCARIFLTTSDVKLLQI